MSNPHQIPWNSLRSFAEGSFDGIAILDAKGAIREWNTRATKLFGRSRAELLGTQFNELITPASNREAFRESFSRIQKGDSSKQTGTLFQVLGHHKTHGRLSLGISMMAITAEPEKLYAIYLRDLPRESSMKSQLVAESTMEQIFHQTTMVSATALSFDQALTQCLDRICDLTDWRIGHAWLPDSTGEVLQSSEIWRSVGDAPLEVFRKRAENRRLRPGQGFAGQIWERRRPCWISDLSAEPSFAGVLEQLGNAVWGAFGFPIFIQQQLIAVLEFFSSDGMAPAPHLLLQMRTLGKDLGEIFERRRWDEERRRLATIVESSQDAVISKSPEGIILSWNNGAEQVYGFSADEAVGKPISLILPNEVAEEEPEICRVLEHGKPLRQFETVRRQKNGQLIDVAITVSPIRDANQKIVGTATIERDMTQRKRHEQELLEAKQQAEIANRMKTEFLANISHELRTPMNSIIGMLDLARSSSGVPEAVLEMLETAGESADLLLMLLNDLLDYSRLEVGRFEIETEPFSLRQTMDEVIQIHSLRADEKGLALKSQISEDVPDHLLGDGRRLKQVVMNLVGNAVKFTEQGEVELAIHSVQRDDDRVHLDLIVRDTGPGIDPADQETIFEPFTQTDSTMTREHGGVGLGLAIGRELVEKMQGTLNLDSRPGRGTKFTCRLPCTVRSDDEVPPVKRTPSRRKNRPADLIEPVTDDSTLSILVAEDTPANQKVIQSILEQRGHHVSIAGDGKEAIETFKETDFDLVLMDIQMPVMDGLKATKFIRAFDDKGKAETPIVAITAHAMSDDRESCLEAGVNAYIAKPIDTEEMLHSIERLCQDRNEDSPKRHPQSDRESHYLVNLESARRRLAYNEGIFRDLVKYFIEDFPDLLEAVRQGVKARDAEQIRRAAHSMKGLASNFDAVPAMNIAKDVENAAKNGDVDHAAARQNELAAIFEDMVPILRASL